MIYLVIYALHQQMSFIISSKVTNVFCLFSSNTCFTPSRKLFCSFLYVLLKLGPQFELKLCSNSKLGLKLNFNSNWAELDQY